MVRNQGRDSTIEPAYLAEMSLSNSSGSGYEARIRRLEILVKEIQDIVDGTVAEGYKDGLIYRVSELERIVSELVIEDKIKYDTTTNWNAQSIKSEKGVIYIYSDAKTYEDVPLPRFKVGDGMRYLSNIPFMDQDVVDYLENLIPVTQEEKDYWNNKVRCYMENPQSENLIFTTN